jgi:methyl-accepting chemotaxis protein
LSGKINNPINSFNQSTHSTNQLIQPINSINQSTQSTNQLIQPINSFNQSTQSTSQPINLINQSTNQLNQPINYSSKLGAICAPYILNNRVAMLVIFTWLCRNIIF